MAVTVLILLGERCRFIDAPLCFVDV